MDYFKASEISAAGMVAQKARIEAAATNLANMHSSSADPAGVYRPLTAVIRPDQAAFGQILQGSPVAMTPVRADVVPQSVALPRMSYEPGHPHADAGGMVSYPAIDHTKEMMTVMTALRAYEANLAALQATRTMAAKALEIGSQ